MNRLTGFEYYPLYFAKKFEVSSARLKTVHH